MNIIEKEDKNNSLSMRVGVLHSEEIKTLSNFLRLNYPRCIPLPLIKGSKIPIKGCEFAIDKITDENLWNYWDTIGENLVMNGDADIGLTLRGGIIVIDVDDKDFAEYLITLDGFKDTVSVRSKKGIHFYFESDERCEDWRTSVRPYKNCDGKEVKIDIISCSSSGTGSIIVIPPSKDKEWINKIVEIDVLRIPSFYFDYHYDNLKIPSQNGNVNKSIKNDYEIVKYDKLEKVVMGLDNKRATDYEDWRNICWAIYNISNENDYLEDGKFLIHKFSKKCIKKYDERSVDRFIRYANYKHDGIGIGTIMKFLRLDNETLFNEINDNVVKLDGYSIIDIEEDEVKSVNTVNEAKNEMKSYEDCKIEFEKTHAKVMFPPCFITIFKDKNITCQNRTDFKHTYENLKFNGTKQIVMGNRLVEVDEVKSFVDVWLKDPNMRTYTKIDFIPPPLECDDDVFNLWNGFQIERCNVESSGNVEPFIRHCEYMVNHSAEGLKFILDYFAHLFQKTGELNRIALGFYSDFHGTGKNLLLWLFELMMGSCYYTSTANPEVNLFSRFNENQKHKIIINLDEAKGLHKFNELIKYLITSPTLDYEDKGVRPIKIRNFARIILTTNNDNSLNLELKERRWVLFKTSNEMANNKVYFDELVNYITDKSNQKAIFNFLKERDIENIDWVNDRPITEYYKDVQSMSLDVVIRFINDYIYGKLGDRDGNVYEFSSELFKLFLKWIERTRIKSDLSITSFGKRLKKYNECGITHDEKTSRVRYCFNLEKVKKMLKDNNLGSSYMFVDDC